MTLRGRIKNGRIELDASLEAPDGTLVEVRLMRGREAASADSAYPDIADFTFEDLVGVAKGAEASDDLLVRQIIEKHS